MPIVSRIGRKHPRVRMLYAAIYLVLIAGAATMVYPFLIMVSGSTKSAVDIRQFDPVPRFLFSDEMLYRKHIEGLFNERLGELQAAYHADTPSFENATAPDDSPAAFVDVWEAFLTSRDWPHYAYTLGYVETPVSKTIPLHHRRFKNELIARYDRDISAMNRDLETDYIGWNAFYILPEVYSPRHAKVSDRPIDQAWRNYKERQPMRDRVFLSVEGFFKTYFLKTQYTRDINFYNREHGTDYTSYDDIHLTETIPDGTEAERRDWETFVRSSLNLLWVRVDDQATPTYRGFLRAKYGDIERLNRQYAREYESFSEIPLIKEPPAGGLPFSDWESFVAGWKDPDTGTLYTPAPGQLRIHAVDFMFRDYVADRFGSPAEANARLGTDFASFDEILMPQKAFHYRAFLQHRSELRTEFVTRNYAAVIDYIILHGRGILNTAIYCALAILCALIFNPMAAYAMSRYRLPNTYKLLLFMLICMAFPPMVTQIPVFLMLRDMNLLNTFAALVLPGLAHGYSIFLLKGFFDSLPRELYESAQIDGANEWTMFWNITMSLSKPILAVIALQAFTMAYSNFMMALLICQDEKMWTLMVWLFQLQSRSGQAVMYASLLIAAIPTFIIFLFCQNIIMRGIVVPSEK